MLQNYTSMLHISVMQGELRQEISKNTKMHPNRITTQLYYRITDLKMYLSIQTLKI